MYRTESFSRLRAPDGPDVPVAPAVPGIPLVDLRGLMPGFSQTIDFPRVDERRELPPPPRDDEDEPERSRHILITNRKRQDIAVSLRHRFMMRIKGAPTVLVVPDPPWASCLIDDDVEPELWLDALIGHYLGIPGHPGVHLAHPTPRATGQSPITLHVVWSAGRLDFATRMVPPSVWVSLWGCHPDPAIRTIVCHGKPPHTAQLAWLERMLEATVVGGDFSPLAEVVYLSEPAPMGS